jgi:putative NIF3 family GTP cyclohydrolase 1 type 2
LTINELYHKILIIGQRNDLRSPIEIEKTLASRRQKYDRMSLQSQKKIDPNELVHPYSDTRIITGDPSIKIKNIIVGIDIGAEELLLSDRKKEEDNNLVISHHPIGSAYANYYNGFDLMKALLNSYGFNEIFVEQIVEEKRVEAERRSNSINHLRITQIAEILNIAMLCAHSPADNLCHFFLKKLFEETPVIRLGELLNRVSDLEEFRRYALHYIHPCILKGRHDDPVNNIYLDVTGGTDGHPSIYEKLRENGFDTVVTMHMSGQIYDLCKKQSMNILLLPHIAADSLGMNLLLDECLTNSPEIGIKEMGGFVNVRRIL